MPDEQAHSDAAKSPEAARLATTTISPLGMTRDAFAQACKGRGFSAHKASEAYSAFHRAGDATALPEFARPRIAPIVRRLEEACDEGVTIKFCQRLDQLPEIAGSRRAADRMPLGVLTGSAQHLDIESVIIPMRGNTGRLANTLCVSSQVGCAMGCDFCETAQMGLVRSLSAEEIVAQWWAATHVEKRTISNIVFMGMGEPLDNVDEVLRAIEVLTDRTGPNLPMSSVTISTVGRVDGLRRIAEVVAQPGWKRLGIALSVNAPNDEVRDALMPINKRWDMAELREVMEELVRVRASRKILFEYVLIPGVNDADEHADQLAEWLSPFVRTESRNHIGLLNVIPYNPRRDSPWPAPEEADVDRFIARLIERGVFVKRRRTKGRSQMAACGQLGTAEIRGRKLVGAASHDAANDTGCCDRDG